MDDRATDDDGRLPITATPDDSAPVLTAEVVVSRNGTAECTIFPPDAAEVERLTAWITAKEGSFVDGEEMR